MTDPNNQAAAAPANTDPGKGGAPAGAGGAPVAGAGAPPPAAGAPSSDWRATLPPELRESTSLARYKDVGALGKAFVDLEKTIGRTGVRVPQEGDGPEVRAQFRKALGVPDAPEGYQIAPPEGFPADKWDKDFEVAFRKEAHDMDLSPAQTQRLAKMYADQQSKTYKAIDEARAAANANLKKEWGADAERNFVAVEQAFAEFGTPAGLDENDLAKINAIGLGEKFARLLASIGATGAAIRGPGTGAAAAGPRAIDQINADIEALRKNKGFYDKLAPDYEETKAKYEKLLAEKAALTGA